MPELQRLRLLGLCADQMAFSEKPKGVHWKSYDWPKEQSGVVEKRINAGLAFHIARLAGLLE